MPPNPLADPSFLTQQAMTNSFMSGIQTDNVAVKCFINFLVLSVVGLMTTRFQQICARIQQVFQGMFNKSQKLRPELRFVARDMSTSWATGLSASNEYKAWLEKIRAVIKNTDFQTELAAKIGSERSSTFTFGRRDDTKGRLLRLKEFRERNWHSNEDSADNHTRWMPDQSEPFAISDRIWCYFVTQDNKDGDDDGNNNNRRKQESRVEYELVAYVESVEDQQFLLDFHDKLMTDWYEKQRMTLSAKPHIFELKRTTEEGEVEWNMYPFSSTRRMQHIWFQQKESFLQSYEHFLDNFEDYKRRGDPHTFSALLYGLPGCGKTSLLKALVNHSADREHISHIFIINFSKIENSGVLARLIFDLKVNGHNIPLNQRILVFEDFDANGSAKIFKKRNLDGEDKVDWSDLMTAFGSDDASKEMATGGDDDDASSTKKELSPGGLFKGFGKPKLSLSEVLNILDGINERTGQRCFWTTNLQPPQDHFDSAFLRPGRMDMILEFTRCTTEGVEYLVQQFYDRKIDQARWAHELDVMTDKWSPAEVKQFCKESRTMDACLHLLSTSEPKREVKTTTTPSDKTSDKTSDKSSEKSEQDKGEKSSSPPSPSTPRSLTPTNVDTESKTCSDSS